MTTTQRLTLSQALVKHLAALRVEMHDGSIQPYCGGVFTIFGHGNVAGMGEALVAERDKLTTYRAHNEQTMAHAAIAFAKAQFRQRIMAVSTSIGPGATNMVTAAAVAHVNRLPVLLLPGDVFATRRPDPVLQQIEDFGDGTVVIKGAVRQPGERAKIERSVTYSGCREVARLGKAPLYAGQPGYRRNMDGDGDGIACEDY